MKALPPLTIGEKDILKLRIFRQHRNPKNPKPYEEELKYPKCKINSLKNLKPTTNKPIHIKTTTYKIREKSNKSTSKNPLKKDIPSKHPIHNKKKHPIQITNITITKNNNIYCTKNQNKAYQTHTKPQKQKKLTCINLKRARPTGLTQTQRNIKNKYKIKENQSTNIPKPTINKQIKYKLTFHNPHTNNTKNPLKITKQVPHTKGYKLTTIVNQNTHQMKVRKHQYALQKTWKNLHNLKRMRPTGLTHSKSKNKYNKEKNLITTNTKNKLNKATPKQNSTHNCPYNPTKPILNNTLPKPINKRWYTTPPYNIHQIHIPKNLNKTINQNLNQSLHKPKIVYNIFTKYINSKNKIKNHITTTHIKPCHNRYITHPSPIPSLNTKDVSNTYRKTLQETYHKQPTTPKKNNKTTPLQTPTKTMRKIQTYNPKHHNKNNKIKLTPSTPNHINYRNANIPLNTHHQINLAYKTTKKHKPIPIQYQKTKQNYKHTNPNNKPQKNLPQDKPKTRSAY